MHAERMQRGQRRQKVEESYASYACVQTSRLALRLAGMFLCVLATSLRCTACTRAHVQPTSRPILLAGDAYMDPCVWINASISCHFLYGPHDGHNEAATNKQRRKGTTHRTVHAIRRPACMPTRDIYHAWTLQPIDRPNICARTHVRT